MSNSEQVLSIKPGYILIERPPGFEITLSTQLERLAEISALCAETETRNLLVVGPGTRVRLSTMDVFKLGEQIAKLGLKVAVVELHDASDVDVRFLENVTANRGGPIEFFTDTQHAKDWLGVE